jgi:lipopolysaccharide/colanic/teichoic acid biosynthesis glycosyltransferase
MRLDVVAGAVKRGSYVQQLVKRIFDIVASSVALILLFPVFAVIYLLIRLDSPGPAIFRQDRVGRSGQVFTCLKFRTMIFGADETIHRQAIKRLWAGERLSLVTLDERR